MLGQTIAQYEIVEILGRGGMGVVYRALDTRLKRTVAIKMLPAELSWDERSKKRLFAEARAASSLNHPNICTVYEIGEVRDKLYLVMEYLAGHNLATEIARGPLHVNRTLQIALQVAHALERAHQHRVIHRDIKPSNIQIAEDGTVKILDFGLARVVTEIDPQSPTRSSTDGFLSEPGTVAGTAAYMSPEQIRGEPLDGRSDIFSFGVVMYEMLTGRAPFRGASVFDLTASILRDEPPPLTQLVPGVPSAMAEVVARCLVKDRDHRYPVVARLRTALETLRTGPKTAHDSAPAIAVLYFENLSGETDEYFRDGMTEDIITELCKIRDLRVFPRSAILEYRDKPVTAGIIARNLAATHVLTGSLRRSGDRLRITTQLVAGQSGQLLWGERYDRKLEDVFAIQDEIARTIAAALSITLSPHEEHAIAQKPTEDLQAYDCYLRGRSFTRRCTQPDLEYAVEMYEHAIALDSSFALAYAGLANVCGMFYDWHGQDASWMERGEMAAKRALDLHPELPEALAALARIVWSRHLDYDASIRYALRAIEQKPDTEGAYWTLGQAYVSTDRLAEAAALTANAIEAAGDDYNTYIPYIAALQRLGRIDEAKALRQRHVAILEQHVMWVPEDVRARVLLAVYLAEVGQYDQAVAAVRKAVSLRPHDSAILYNAACTFGLAGRPKDAMEMLERAAAAGLSKWDWVREDPDLACLHDDPEFRRLVREGLERINQERSGQS